MILISGKNLRICKIHRIGILCRIVARIGIHSIYGRYFLWRLIITKAGNLLDIVQVIFLYQRNAVRINNIVQLNPIPSLCSGAVDTEFCRIVITQIIIKMKRHNSSARTIHIRVVLIQNTRRISSGGGLCPNRQIILIHNLQCRHNVRSDIAGFRVYLPSHYLKTGTCHNQVSSAVNGKGTVSGKEVLCTIVYNEERLTRNHDIKRIIGRLCGTLSGDCRGDCRCLSAKTDLSGVRTASSGRCISTGCRLCLLI